MKRLRLLLVFSCLACLALLSGWLVTADTRKAKRQTPVPQKNAEPKIADWLQARLAAAPEQEFEFLVIMKDQADLRGAEQLTAKIDKGRFVRDTLRAKAQTTQANVIAWLRERNLTFRSFFIINGLWVKGTREIATQLAARADVASVEGNPLINMQQPIELAEPDPNLLNHTAQTVEAGISYIRATDLWALGFKGQGVVIAGQDTGVAWDHPALRAKYRGLNGSGANEMISHDFNWHDSIHSGGGPCGPDSAVPCDDNNHGTHTVGTVIGSDATNQIGVAPEAKFIACRNMDRGNGTPATYLECFEFMLAPYPVNGTPAQGDPAKAPDLTVNSWGCPPSEGCKPDTIKLAVEAQRAAGIFTVVSAGNSGPSCGSVNDPPAQYAAVYSVGALDAATGLIAGFSSRGPVTIDGSNRLKPEISAPGVRVRSAVRGNGYASLNGTSMAGPHVAGAIAVLWSARPELKNQIALTENLLSESATRVAATECAAPAGNQSVANNTYGFGRLDVKAAYDLAGAQVTLSSNTAASTGAILRATVTAGPAVKWRAVSNASWITANSTEFFTSDGETVVTVAPNPASTVRTGTITVAARTFTITQAGTAPYEVAGRVADSLGNGMPRVTIQFVRVDNPAEGAPASITTDSDGRWLQSGFLPGGTYRATAMRSRQNFSPTSVTFSAPQTINFIVSYRRVEQRSMTVIEAARSNP